MSYILDALRRADSERDRGAVPGVHARQVPLAGDGDAPAARLPGWLWPVAALVVLVIGALVWMLLGRDPPRERAAAMPMPTVVPLPVPSPAPAPAPTTPPAALPSATPAPRPPLAVPAVPSVKPPARVLPAAPASAPVTRPEGAPEPKAKALVAEPRIFTLAELPEDIRRELPTLAIGGAMYSENPANRMLIINGQTFHERDQLAPGLRLVQIKLKSAVLEFKGLRYGISY